MDAHDTHCCIVKSHGCKYGDENCPVANGIRKQVHLCEQCGLETEGYYGEPPCTEREQREYIDALWEEKQNPRKLTPTQEILAELAERHGKSTVIGILEIVNKHEWLTNMAAIELLKDLKHIR